MISLYCVISHLQIDLLVVAVIILNLLTLVPLCDRKRIWYVAGRFLVRFSWVTVQVSPVSWKQYTF